MADGRVHARPFDRRQAGTVDLHLSRDLAGSECGPGLGQQFLDVLPLPAGGDAGAGDDRHLDVADEHGLAKGGGDRAGHVDCGSHRRRLEQGCELVATDAGHDLPRREGAEQPRHGGDEHLVARRASPPLVDVVEPRELDDEQAPGAAGARLPLQVQLEVVHEQPAGRQLGQRVVEHLPEEAVAQPVGTRTDRRGADRRVRRLVRDAAVTLELLEREDLDPEERGVARAEPLDLGAPMGHGDLQRLGVRVGKDVHLNGIPISRVQAHRLKIAEALEQESQPVLVHVTRRRACGGLEDHDPRRLGHLPLPWEARSTSAGPGPWLGSVPLTTTTPPRR